VIGAKVRERATGAETDVYAKVVMNCTGAFADEVRKQSDVSVYVQASLFLCVCLCVLMSWCVRSL